MELITSTRNHTWRQGSINTHLPTTKIGDEYKYSYKAYKLKGYRQVDFARWPSVI